MKLRCTKEKIQSAISKAEKIAGKNPNLPVLSCVLLEAKERELVIRSTNLDLGIEVVIPAKIDQQGVVAVPANLLASYIAQIPENPELELVVKDGNLLIEAGKNKTLIKAMNHEDFPSIPRVTSENTVSLPSRDIVSGFKSVFYSAHTSTMKPEYASVYVHSEDGHIVFVATDAHRLAEKKIRTQNVEIKETVLIPSRNVSEIVRVLESAGNEDVTITLDKNQISFHSYGWYVVSRIVDAMFPDYKQIIPKESQTDVTILKQDLASALKLSNIFSDNSHQIQITINPATESFLMASRSAEKGENQNAIPAVIEGQELTIAFNYRYIMDCLSSIQSESVVLKFAGPNKPAVIRGVSDPSFLYLLMPNR